MTAASAAPGRATGVRASGGRTNGARSAGGQPGTGQPTAGDSATVTNIGTAATGSVTGPSAPAVPVRVRSAVYFIALTISAVVVLVTGFVTIYAPSEATRIAAAGGVVTAVVGLVSSGLGAAYTPRPN